MKRTSTYRKLAAATVVVGGLGAYGAPALAAGSQSQTSTVTYSTTTGCSTCRTLNLYDTQGNKLNGLDISSGAGAFIANVQDQGVDPAAVGNFNVQATMTNLYMVKSGGGYDCSTFIPSGDVSLDSLPSLLDANSLGAVLQPVFNVTGTIDSTLLTPLGLSGLNPTPTFSETGVATTLDQTALAGGSTATDLLGSILGNSSLPVNLTSAAGGAFANPDDPTSLGCTLPSGSPAATPQPVMQGALNGLPTLPSDTLTGPLVNDLNSQINPSATNPLPLSALIPSQVSVTQAAQDIAYYTNIPIQDLLVNGVPTALLTSIEGQLFATLSGVVNSVTQLTGNYNATPHMAINQTGATKGSYQGVLTVTMTQS